MRINVKESSDLKYYRYWLVTTQDNWLMMNQATRDRVGWIVYEQLNNLSNKINFSTNGFPS